MGKASKAFIVLCLVLLSASLPAAAADKFPTGPVKIIVSNAPGGANDILARLIAEKLTPIWGQQVVVENRPGASSIIGSTAVAKSAPDGHTLYLATSTFSVTAALERDVPYNSASDFEMITAVGTSPTVLTVNAKSPLKTVQDLIALAKERPGKITHGSAGIGTAGWIALGQFTKATGTEFIDVAYKGLGPAMTDLIGNQITFIFGNPIVSQPLMETGQVRALAVTSAGRLPALPSIPTMDELGIKNVNYEIWWGIFGPAKIPREITEKIAKDISALLDTPEFADRLNKLGMQRVALSGDAFRKYVTDEMERMKAALGGDRK